MAFKVYPQPPFKKFVKTEVGDILQPDYKSIWIEPAVYNKKGYPLFRFGWLIMYDKHFEDGSGIITLSCKIVATADTKEELL